MFPCQGFGRAGLKFSVTGTNEQMQNHLQAIFQAISWQDTMQQQKVIHQESTLGPFELIINV